MLEEMSHILELRPGDPLRMLLFSSFLRDDLPWLYELGVEAYRASTGGNNPVKARKANHRFMSAIQTLRRGPFLRELGNKDTYMLVEAMEHSLRLDRRGTEADPDVEPEKDEGAEPS